MKWREEKNLHQWTVPYIPIDPQDINCTYDADVIRVNSQSGKGGIGYLLEQTYGYVLPAKMREHLSYLCKSISDHEHRELKVSDVLEIFQTHYFNHTDPISLSDMRFLQQTNGVKGEIVFARDGQRTSVQTQGNGSLDAVSNALKAYTGSTYKLRVYTEHSMQGQSSGSTAAAYIGLEKDNGEMCWGVGTDTDIIRASAHALLSAYNNMVSEN